MQAEFEIRVQNYLSSVESVGKMYGKVKRDQVKLLLDVSGRFIHDCVADRVSYELLERFTESREYLASQLDGEREIIENSTRAHFLSRHVQKGESAETFECHFLNKTSGDQTGVIAMICSKKYFVKTHQHGPTFSNPRSVCRPDSKEIFIYKLLALSGLGPAAHFILPIHGQRRTIYIATEDASFTQLIDLTEETADFKALLLLDLIARILCLSDCTTNETNCGQSAGEPVIVDFRILEREDYSKSDVLQRFVNGNKEYNYTNLMMRATSVNKELKISIATEALALWSLLDNIKYAETETRAVMTRIKGDDGDPELIRYVEGVSRTVKCLLQDLKNSSV